MNAARLTPALAVVTALGAYDFAAADAGDPGARFADGVSRRARQGWHLAALEVTEPPLSGEGSLRLVVTMADDRRAERWVVELDAAGRAPTRVSVDETAAPQPRRYYRGERALLDALQRGPVRSLSYECASYLLTVGDHASEDDEAVVDALDFYVLESRATGPAAQQAFAEAIARAAEEGRVLSGADPGRGVRRGQQHAVELVFTGRDVLVLRAGLDREDRVVELEVQRSPWQPTLQRYPSRRQRALARVAKRHGGVVAAQWDPAPRGRDDYDDEDDEDDAPGILRLTFADGTQFRIRPDEFGAGEVDCQC